MYTLRSLWNDSIRAQGIPVDENNNSRIIIDDTFVFSESFRGHMLMLRSIATICRAFRLSLKLEKCIFLPNVVQFVGVNVSIQGNRPAATKMEMLQQWPTPTTVRDVASFIGFVLFYSRWIPYFEIRASRLRELLRRYPMDHHLTSTDLSPEVLAEVADLKEAVLSQPILRRADHRKRFYLKTDFSSVGMGWVICQPGDDAPSWEAMMQEDAGGPCQFELSVN